MIDGIKTYCVLSNFLHWKEETGIEFNVTMNEDTGEVKQITRPDKKSGLSYTKIEHKGKFETYELTINEITHTGNKTKYILTIEGSLHKNHFDGENYKRFTFTDLCNQIDYLCLNLHLNPIQCKFKTFEYGFNLPVKFKPIEYLENNLMSYKGKQFERFKTKSKVLIGYDTRLSEYRIKLYDKGLQHNLKYQLMRFEKAYNKMTSPKRIGIFTLADLTKLAFLKGLQKELLQAWNKVLLFDSTVFKYKNLPVQDENFLLKCQGINFWKKFKNTSSRKYNKDKFQNLLLKYGIKGNIHNEVKELLINEFKNCTLLPNVKREVENQKPYTFTVNIEGKTVQSLEKVMQRGGNDFTAKSKTKATDMIKSKLTSTTNPVTNSPFFIRPCYLCYYPKSINT